MRTKYSLSLHQGFKEHVLEVHCASGLRLSNIIPVTICLIRHKAAGCKRRSIKLIYISIGLNYITGKSCVTA